MPHGEYADVILFQKVGMIRFPDYKREALNQKEKEVRDIVIYFVDERYR